MAQTVNQVIVNGETVLDLRSDTVTPETLKTGYKAHDKSGAVIVGTMPVAKNPHSTTWDFAERVGILTPFNETYVFDPVSQTPYLQYLSTDDTRWINGYLNRSSGTTKRPTVFAESKWAPSVTSVTEDEFVLNTVRTGTGILVPYFIGKGQTIYVTYTHSTTDYGGYIWCDKNGKFIDVEFIDGLGAGTSEWNYTAPTDGWIYIIFMRYDENASGRYSDISVTIE